MNKVHFYFFLFSPLVWVCLVIKGVVHCNSQRASHVTSPFFFFILKEFFSLSFLRSSSIEENDRGHPSRRLEGGREEENKSSHFSTIFTGFNAIVASTHTL